MNGVKFKLDGKFEKSLENWLDGDDGRAEIVEEAIQDALTNGEGAALTRGVAEEVASQFYYTLVAFAGRELAPSAFSVLKHITDMTWSDPIHIEKNEFKIEFSFNGNLSRNSLNPSSDGVYDIIGLLVHGWRHKNGHKKPPRGMWHGHKTRGLWKRDAATFMYDAVSWFNNNYANEYRATVELDEAYM